MAYRRENRELAVAHAVVPLMPDTCGVLDCQAPTAVAFAVGTKDGRHVTTHGSDLLDPVRDKENPKHYTGFTEKSGCHFERWITRCAVCYERERIHRGNQQGSSVIGTDRQPKRTWA